MKRNTTLGLAALGFLAMSTFAACSDEPAPTPPPAPAPVPPPPAPAPAPRLPDLITVSGRLQFESDSAVLLETDKVLLMEVVRVMKDNPQIKLVEIGGHTDSDGDEDSNLLLSENRAKSAMAYIISQGIEPHRMRARGYGELIPVRKNDTEPNKLENRRVEFRIVEQ